MTENAITARGAVAAAGISREFTVNVPASVRESVAWLESHASENQKNTGKPAPYVRAYFEAIIEYDAFRITPCADHVDRSEDLGALIRERLDESDASAEVIDKQWLEFQRLRACRWEIDVKLYKLKGSYQHRFVLPNAARYIQTEFGEVIFFGYKNQLEVWTPRSWTEFCRALRPDLNRSVADLIASIAS